MNPSEISQSIISILHLETQPVAVKMYKDKADLPRHTQNIQQNFCQLVSIARYQGRGNSGTAESMICAFGAACLGLIETPEVISSGKAGLGIYTGNPQAAKNFMSNVFKIGDSGKQYEAVMVKPLAEVAPDEQPDAVIIYVNPAQAMRLIHASTYDTGEKITADTVAEGAMCSCTAFAIANQKPTVGFPCAGDRIFGGTQNHELVYTAPYSLVTGKLVENLEATAKGGFSVFPVPPNMHWTPAMPPAYTIQPEYLDK
ncbi:DUF169 domain-containing protein [Pelolinea submarina]|uniref:Uncharacterized protein (DUF169 family) n=1 Tax=Pelolinea submarina TaxID=913107 RepID=A0A3E0AFI1_9CHLR|nr:DUF169 domain-containing protein [Pelolinea submarina]REG10421.1 uncharacterized protein (DUF169 family) [Pelolinea submarina]